MLFNKISGGMLPRNFDGDWLNQINVPYVSCQAGKYHYIRGQVIDFLH